MTAWVKPAELLKVYKEANSSEWRRHLKWFREAGYPQIKQLEALVDREHRKRDTPSETVHEG